VTVGKLMHTCTYLATFRLSVIDQGAHYHIDIFRPQLDLADAQVRDELDDLKIFLGSYKQ